MFEGIIKLNVFFKTKFKRKCQRVVIRRNKQKFKCYHLLGVLTDSICFFQCELYIDIMNNAKEKFTIKTLVHCLPLSSIIGYKTFPNKIYVALLRFIVYTN